MKIFSKKMAFTMAETMITLSIIAIVAVAISKIAKSRTNYETKFMTYSAFSVLAQGLGVLISDGCTTTPVTGDVAKGYCASAASLPSTGHNADSRGLCDRLTNVFNTVGAVNCSAATATTTAAFIDTNLNFKLANGLKFFNLNTAAPYTIYVDLNGDKGSHTLGQDVVAFTVNTNGLILPTSGTTAATDTNYLSASVKYLDDFTSPTNAVEVWVERGVSFYTATCDATGSYNGTACATTVYNNNCLSSLTPHRICQVIIDKPGYRYINPR